MSADSELNCAHSHNIYITISNLRWEIAAFPSCLHYNKMSFSLLYFKQILSTDKTLAALLQLADEYDMQQVFYNCKEYMMKRINSWPMFAFVPTDNILFYLGLVEQYKRLHPLRQILVDKASGISAHDMEKSKYFTSVPATATRDALLQRLKTKEPQPPINRGFLAFPFEKK